MPPPSATFNVKKSTILNQLSVPASSYDDLSPKGSIDAGIRDLIDEINAVDGFVTTSSCSGRVAVFLEGERRRDQDEQERTVDNERVGEDEGEDEETRTKAGVGGKGGGGRWLFVSHDAVDLSSYEFREENGGIMTALGMKRVGEGEKDVRGFMGQTRDTRFIHFKFEPFILHILTDSLASAQAILKAALQAGFRESGAINLTLPTSTSNPATINPIVAVRSMGLSLESIIGFHHQGQEICMVPEWQLHNLVELSNKRFAENKKRIERFRELLIGGKRTEALVANSWEDSDVRRERMRAEGLKRREALREEREEGGIKVNGVIEELGLEFPEDNL
ncbi:hypothetical protein B7463_g1337, partial [Scytalidium lignicola]